jgi:hypothetical protein
MYIPDIYQNDRDEKLNQKKFTLTITRIVLDFKNLPNLIFLVKESLLKLQETLELTNASECLKIQSIFINNEMNNVTKKTSLRILAECLNPNELRN